MTDDANVSLYRSTIEAAMSERHTIQQEIANVEATLARLRTREAALNAMVHALHSVLPEAEMTVEREELESADIATSGVGPAASARTSAPLPRPSTLSRRPSESSSPYRVGLILRDQNQPMTRQQIIDEYRVREWFKPDWKDPEANLVQAIRRAVTYGWAEQVPGRKSTYVTTQAASVGPSAGTSGNEEGE